MTNIILLICTISAGFLVGKHFELKQKRKGDFFCDLKKYVVLLKTNVKSRRVELATFNAEFIQNSSRVFSCFLQNKVDVDCLSKSQRRLVFSLFDELSANTSSQLLDNLDYYERLVEEERNALSNAVRDRSVCVKLGVLLGVMIGILLM